MTYKINALGQRVQKTGAGTYVYSTTTTINATTGLSPQAASIPFNARYVYDEQGRLLGEYSPEGKLITETIWFDDLPVATLRPKGSSVQLPLGIAGTAITTANNAGNNTPANPVNVDVFYLHPDHLGTPRAATRSVAVAGATTGPNAINKATWRWESDPFGTSLNASAPNGNPQNVIGTAGQITAASFRVNNRFPGQVFDAESAKSYNYFRDYDPAIGRYVESDPIGLRGGTNTFGYVKQQPTRFIDPSGLIEWNGGYAAYTVFYGYVGRGLLFFSLSSPCVRGQQWHVKVTADASYASFGFPFSVVGSGVTLEDGSDWVNPYVFNGRFSMWTAGAAFGGGYGYTDMQVGGARTAGSGAYGGIDGYVAIAAGKAWVTDAKPSTCCGK